ncbi:hypothetical protein [Desulfosporosinus sp. FKB]|uniref:hypothetical protein n=1 Tax=Desulfosporosinus sp. FKB TaxID=1969835 RepID=UPI000B4A2F42|nr:hypothetical protein [Desulfosporosinus sp. FKB]
MRILLERRVTGNCHARLNGGKGRDNIKAVPIVISLRNSYFVDNLCYVGTAFTKSTWEQAIWSDRLFF